MKTKRVNPVLFRPMAISSSSAMASPSVSGRSIPAPSGAELSKDQMDFMAARFAKLGVNMVRIHGGLFDRSGDDPTKIDAARLDNYFYLINALKKQGIYVHLLQLFSLAAHRKGQRWHLGNRRRDIIGKIPFGLLIFEPRMQEIYKSWIRQILTTKSLYSGKTLAEETAVGVFEIQNEDSLFFWEL